MQSLPEAVRQRMSVKLFCSCFADELRDTLTKEELESISTDSLKERANPSSTMVEEINKKRLNAQNTCRHHIE
jgi:hypothetical protein